VTRPVSILLSETAHDRYWARIVDCAPQAEAVQLRRDGTRSGTTDRVEVAWVTTDVYPDLAGGFFGTAVRTPSLRWLQSAAAGFDNPVYARLVDAGVRVTSAHVSSGPIAELVVRAILDHAHDGPRWRAAQAARAWSPARHGNVLGTTWTMVGFGSIGRAVARVARALGARVHGVRRHPSPDDPADEMFPLQRLHDAVTGAFAVVLAVPLDAGTAGLADEALFGAMAPGSILVNVGRGELVDEQALLRALDRGAPEAAALDVFATEPLPPDHPFWDHPRVAITPHVAGMTTGADDRLSELFVANLGAYLRGEPLAHEAHPTDLAVN